MPEESYENKPNPSRQATSREQLGMKEDRLGSKVKVMWEGMGIDLPTFLLMLKGALPPTLVLAMCQSNAVANLLGSLGYLSAISRVGTTTLSIISLTPIVSIIGLCILPRARFIQNLVVNVTAICIGASCGMLTVYTTVKARQHTTQPGATLTSVPYNSSASVVSATWLFFWVYVVSTARAKIPQLQFGAILFTINVIVSCSNAPLMPNMTAGNAFGRSLIIAELVGMAVATGVSLVIMPVSCRTLVVKLFTDYLSAIRVCLQAQKWLLHSLESHDAMADLLTVDCTPREEALAVNRAIDGIFAVHAELQANLPFAKQEISWGKLGSGEFTELNKLLRFIMLPVTGMGSVMDILQQIAKVKGWTKEHVNSLSEEDKSDREQGIVDWNNNMRLIHDSIGEVINAMDEGIEHILLRLELKTRPKQKKSAPEPGDVESKAQSTAPGEGGFAAYLGAKITTFYTGKQLNLTKWGKLHGIELPPDFFDHPYDVTSDLLHETGTQGQQRRHQNQRQLYLLLYLEFLLHSIGKNLLALVEYVDGLYESGKIAKGHMILPKMKQLGKILQRSIQHHNIAAESTLQDVGDTGYQVYMGEAYSTRKDPEHLPPTNWFQKSGNRLRAIANFLRSPEAAFGLRVAVATLSLSLPIWIRQTQNFSNSNRAFWAVIMTAVSMNPTSGQSVSSFLAKTVGTVVAMFLAWLVWYIPGNGKTPGVIVLYWAFTAPLYYFPLVKPQYATAAVIGVITTTLIIGYELEASKLGRAAIEDSGQNYLSTLRFGPVRLATVLAGLFVGFFWTIFPYPVSEHSVLRNDMGGALHYLANYYSIVHETVALRMQRAEGNMDDTNSPGRTLQKMRSKVFNKQTRLIESLKEYSKMVRWEIPVGGRFPKAQYDSIIECIQRITNYISLVSVASSAYVDEDPEGTGKWSSDFRRLMGAIEPTSHEITMILTLLSAAVRNGQSLPPFLPRPQPSQLTARLEELDKDILSVRHINEPGYAVFAVLHLSASCIEMDVNRLIDIVRGLVGELDFSFRVVWNGQSSSDVADPITREGDKPKEE